MSSINREVAEQLRELVDVACRDHHRKDGMIWYDIGYISSGLRYAIARLETGDRYADRIDEPTQEEAEARCQKRDEEFEAWMRSHREERALAILAGSATE